MYSARDRVIWPDLEYLNFACDQELYTRIITYILYYNSPRACKSVQYMWLFSDNWHTCFSFLEFEYKLFFSMSELFAFQPRALNSHIRNCFILESYFKSHSNPSGFILKYQ